MKLRRKKVVIDWEDGKAEVVVKELTWGEMNDVLAASTVMENIGGVNRVRFDFARYREELMVRAIESAPFTVNRENVRALPARVAEQIWKVVEELNPLM